MFSRIATAILLVLLALFVLNGCGAGYGRHFWGPGPGTCGGSWFNGSGGYGPGHRGAGW